MKKKKIEQPVNHNSFTKRTWQSKLDHQLKVGLLFVWNSIHPTFLLLSFHNSTGNSIPSILSWVRRDHKLSEILTKRVRYTWEWGWGKINLARINKSINQSINSLWTVYTGKMFWPKDFEEALVLACKRAIVNIDSPAKKILRSDWFLPYLKRKLSNVKITKIISYDCDKPTNSSTEFIHDDTVC